MSDLRSIARALGGNVHGRSVIFPAPGHSRNDRSASLILSASAPDGFIVHSFAGEDPLALKDYVRERLGLQRLAKPGPLSKDELVGRFSAPDIVDAEERKERTARALGIWKGGREP